MNNTYEVKLISLAQKDLSGIYDYIANTLMNITAAKKQANDFIHAFELMSEMPYANPKVQNELIRDKELRKALVNNYIVFYKVNEEEKIVNVIRVLYGMMNYQEIL